MLGSVVGSLKKDDAELKRTILIRYKDSFRNKERWSCSLGQALGQLVDSENAGDMFRSINEYIADEGQWETIFRETYQGLLNKDLRLGLGVLGEEPDDSLRGGLYEAAARSEQIFDEVNRNGLEPLLAWFPDCATRERARTTYFRQWARVDFQGAWQDLELLECGSRRDAVVEAVLQEVPDLDPAGRAALLDSMSDRRSAELLGRRYAAAVRGE